MNGYANGFEFNFPRLFASNESVGYGASGTYSYFDYDRGVEWAFPFLYKRYKGVANHYGRPEDSKEYWVSLASLDIHYRKFLGDEFGGFYLSGFGRVAHIRGLRDSGEKALSYDSNTKFGLGVGAGYRFFPTNSRIYWGIGIVIGRYIVGENDLYYYDAYNEVDDSALIVDIEFLKVGYAF